MAFISPLAVDSNGNTRQTGSLQQLGKDDFLQLLVAQMENQDPLEPMSNEESLAQLAQFSSLEQMNNIADGISQSNDLDFLQSQSLNNVMATSLVGKDAKASYSGVYYEPGNETTINYTMPSNADEVVFTIRDSAGSAVTTITQDSVKAGVNSFVWDGTNSFGNRVDEGYYYIEAAATLDGNSITPSLSLVGKVESVIYRDGTAYLTVGGTEIPLGDIEAVGEPGAFTGGNDDDSGNDDV
ncbi:MAG: hypothetical protein DWP97_04275 [Calditrichaeota bacterium]|nr:MAG: hypothetical protein DWP97_04275 [Calditrichota bacterium]